MGIIKKIKKQKEEIYQIFGIPVCTITKSYNYKYKTILRILSKTKKYENYTEHRITKLFNLPLLERIENLDIIELKVLNTFKRVTDKEEETKKILKKIVKSKYNKIFILKSNLGEAYLFLKFILNNLILKSDVPLIIATKKYHINLINMLTPNIDKIYTANLHYEINNKVMLVGEQYVYVAFPMKFYTNTEEKIRNGHCHYMSEIYNFFNISKKNISSTNNVKISQELKKRTRDYLQKNNIKKFVFLSTDATTCENIDKKFWDKLEKELNIKIIKNSKDMTLEEAYAIAHKALAIISLRSGLSEILSGINNLQIILYTNFKERYRFDVISEMKVSKGFSLKAIEPNRKNIFELEYSKESEDKIIEWIKDIVNMRAKIK